MKQHYYSFPVSASVSSHTVWCPFLLASGISQTHRVLYLVYAGSMLPGLSLAVSLHPQGELFFQLHGEVGSPTQITYNLLTMAK